MNGHICFRCFHRFDQTQDNPAKTDWCVKCGHRSEGIKRGYVIGDWLICHVLDIAADAAGATE